MKLECVLTACNDNELYLEFIPVFIKAWKKLIPTINIKIILIANEIPKKYLKYEKYIILFSPILNVSTAFTSQYIRMLYPCILDDIKGGILMTDMDIIPMSRRYYYDLIKNIPNDHFIYYRDDMVETHNQIAMCYNVALKETWEDIFDIHNIEDIKKRLTNVSNKINYQNTHGGNGWFTDQLDLYRHVMEWNKLTKKFTYLKDKETGFNRLDRDRFNYDNKVKNAIKTETYTDYHALRPYNQYKKINDEVVELLPYYDLEFNENEYKLTNLCSPMENKGLFDIYLNDDIQILYKKAKQPFLKTFDEQQLYRYILTNMNLDKKLGNYVVNVYVVEEDGSYYTNYINNTIRLFDIKNDTFLDNDTLIKIKNKMMELKNTLINVATNDIVCGDWALHNLLYSYDDDKIYNIDMEGFYTYPYVHNNSCCNLNDITKRFDNFIKIIDGKLNYFTLIIWNPALKFEKEILENIPNIIEIKKLKINNDIISSFIYKVYELDTRCSHDIVLPKKIDELKKYNSEHLMIKFYFDDILTYENDVCKEAIKIKENIRNTFKTKLDNYIRDIIIHVADNYEQSKHIWNIDFELLNSHNTLQAKCVYPFLKRFIEVMKLDINLNELNIYHSLNHIEKDIYVRKETHDIEFKDLSNIKLFIDSLDKKLNIKNYYHVIYGAISYYLRDFEKQHWKKLLLPLNRIETQMNKKKFCVHMFLNNTYRNGKKRYDFYKTLNNIKTVDDIKNNFRFELKMYEEAVNSYKPYRFAIVFENDIVDGWITEKIFNAFLAGCIPIYDGTDDIYKYFNKDSFINAKDFDSLEDLAKYVVKVDETPELYNKYINNSPTNICKLQKIFWWEKIIETHQDCYDYLLDEMNENDVEFVIMRGFKYLPLKADTDLDIVIHPKSYNKFIDIYTKLYKKKLINMDFPKKYNHETHDNLYYTSLFTKGSNGQHLPGNYYRFDTYNDLFFYKHGEGYSNDALLPNPLFKKYLFDNKLKIKNYYIPNMYSEIVLLIYRNLYDKKGKWVHKHIDRINEIIKRNDFNENEFKKVCNLVYLYKDVENVIQCLKKNEFNNFIQPNQQMNIFLIRKMALKENIINDILEKIKDNGFHIIKKMFVSLTNKQKFYSDFYNEKINEYENEIMDVNKNQCLVIITEFNGVNNLEPNYLKNIIRQKYIDFYPPIGNIIHSSDSPNDCLNELSLLLNEKITNFKNIGTYYSQIDSEVSKTLIILNCKNKIFNNICVNVNNLRKNYPKCDVIIVNSEISDIKKYEELNIETLFYDCNNNDHKMFQYLYNKYPNYDKYFCLRDNLICKENYILDLSNVDNENVFIMKNNSGFLHHPSIINDTKTYMNQTIYKEYFNTYNLHNGFDIIKCNSFILTNENFKKLLETLPKFDNDVNTSPMCERIYAIVLKYYNIKLNEMNNGFIEI